MFQFLRDHHLGIAPPLAAWILSFVEVLPILLRQIALVAGIAVSVMAGIKYYHEAQLARQQRRNLNRD